MKFAEGGYHDQVILLPVAEAHSGLHLDSWQYLMNSHI